jgi:3-deoxy-D-manno-octulosonic acid kinase
MPDRNFQPKLAGNGVTLHRAAAFSIGLAGEPEPARIASLTALLNSPPQCSGKPLSGRRSVIHGQLPGIGPVVVKQYHRGGLLRHVNRRTYLRLGKSRCRAEFERLRQVRAVGIRAPCPVAFATRGTLLYHAWLVTRKLAVRGSLAEIGRIDRDAAERSLVALAAQLHLLVRHRIFHVDLHPGNVLVGTDGSVYLIDFDKSRRFRGPAPALLDRYRSRWRRAVSKHRLPSYLAEWMEAAPVDWTGQGQRPGH